MDQAVVEDVLPICIKLPGSERSSEFDPCFSVGGAPAHRNSVRIKKDWVGPAGYGRQGVEKARNGGHRTGGTK